MSAESPQFLDPEFGKPHVVILGAGASLAAFQNGDKHGHKLPLMNNLIDVVGLGSLLEEYEPNIRTGDFEEIYSSLYKSGKHPDLIAKLEEAVFEYFAVLELPDSPTLYDHLVLSLRRKDLIATFNWDPLLWQALCRNAERFGQNVLPNALYLHGNVAIGYCNNHKPGTIGNRGCCCTKCGSPFVPSHLLYPVMEKNYDNPSWNEIQKHLKQAHFFTIFGYSAPDTDKKAMKLMKKAWGNVNLRESEQIEIIDIRPHDELRESWKLFTCRDHYSILRNFDGSFLAQHPRRSCEDFWEASMQSNPQDNRPIQHEANWEQLEEFFKPLIEQELAFRK